MTDVLGTPLFAVPGSGAAFLVSDLHVPTGGGGVVDNLDAVLTAAANERARVFVLGDLFDSYVTPAQVRTGVWRDVAERFARAGAAGVEVTVLHGNRDFLLGAEFTVASGARVVGGGVRVDLGGVDTVLLHGDELCQNDRPYQRAKRWLRHPWTRAVARRLPLRLALAAAARARARSRKVVGSGDQARFLPTTAAVDAAYATGARQLVFGHIHRFAHGRHGGGEYWVLPAFDATATGLFASAKGLAPVRFLAGGATTPVETPAACPFVP